MASQKTLYILRHAKTEQATAQQEDADRALTERGIHDAQVMGTYMAERQFHVDKVLCSTAARTRQTWDYMQAAYSKKPPVEYHERLYLASANEILNALAQVGEDTKSLLLIGHNPGLHQLALTLAHSGNEEELEFLALQFPTSALAIIAFKDTPWKQIKQAGGTLLSFVTPKRLGS